MRTVQVGQMEFENILVDHKDIAAEDIKRHVYRTWGNHLTRFQDQVQDGYALQQIFPGQNPDHIQTFY